MQEKKELLLKVLQKLMPYRDLAEGIIAVVESEYTDEETLATLSNFLQEIVVKIKNTPNQENEKLFAGFIGKESSQREKELEEVESLLAQLNNK